MYNEIERLQVVIDMLLYGRQNIKVLEAGCGSISHVRLPPDSHVVGIDISEKQLAENNFVTEKILGDIQTYKLPEAGFDMIVCWDVLEHIIDPQLALRNFVKSLKRGGIIVLAVPNIFSMKGLLTKYTPHRFHVWAYKNVFGFEKAIAEGRGPFPTFLKFSISPAAIKKFARDNDLSVEYFAVYEAAEQKILKDRYKILKNVWRIFGSIIGILSAGRISVDNTDYIIVLRNTK